MSTLPTNRIGTNIPVHINGVDFPSQVYRVKVTQNENEHETASLFVRSPSSGTDFLQLPSQRVEFTYGLFGNKNTFQGYVADVIPSQRMVNGISVQEQEIVCLGPSMVFKGNKPRFWDQTTATDAMRSIVAERSLGFSDESRGDNYPWRQLAQTSETDWEMLVNLAHLIGCTVTVTRGVVRLIDYNDVATREQPTRVFKRDNTNLTPRSVDVSLSNRLLTIQSLNSSMRDPVYRNPQFAFLGNGKSVSVVEDVLPRMTPGHPQSQAAVLYQARFVTDRPVNSAVEAAQLMSGHYVPEWTQSASARVSGDAGMHPCCVVRINTQVNNPQRNIGYDGDWYVHGVVHNVWINQYYTDLTLGRAVDRRSNWYQETPFWLGDKRGIPKLTYVGTGQWVSSWR